MIGKIIRMNSAQRRTLGGHIRGLRDNVFALSRYVLDADPYSLIAEAEQAILSLSDYALAMQTAGVEPGEKVAASGVRNLYGNDLADWQAEMLSVAARAHRKASPLVHIIISLSEGESWTADQREETITIILQTLRLERCPVIWAEHSNTANAHLHLSVVRINPETGQGAGTDWLIDDLHQALALVEERQGRAREPNAIYLAREGAVYDADTQIMVRDASGRYLSDWYKKLGKKHDRMPRKFRPMRASIVAAIQDAGSWAELHAALEEIGVTYDRSGSGARIELGGVSAKASELHSLLSRPQLEQRFGIFEPDLSRLDAGYEAYRHAFEAQLAGLRQARDAERQRLNQWMAATLAALPPRTAKALGPVIRAEAEAGRASLADAFKQAITRCTKSRLSEQAWIAAARPAVPPPVMTPALLLPACRDGAEHDAVIIPAFERRQMGWATEYRFDDGPPLFTDHRTIIIVHAIDHPACIDEALRIAAARWGSVAIKGPESFLRLATVRAASLGIRVVDDQGRPLLPAEEPVVEVDCAAYEDRQPVAQETARAEDDPIRRERIDAAIAFLRDFKGLPLRRIAMSDDDAERGRTGPLEIDVAGDPFDQNDQQLAREAIFDGDPGVQAFLEEQRRDMLDEWRILLLCADMDPMAMAPEKVIRCLPAQSEIRRPAYLARHDRDFLDMLDNVREALLDKERARGASGHARMERQDDVDETIAARMIAREQSPAEEASTEISLKSQVAWHKSRTTKTL